MFQDELDTTDKLLTHLDKRASWGQHKQERFDRLHKIADRYLESLFCIVILYNHDLRKAIEE